MKTRELLRRLIEEHGAVVRTEYHLQLAAGTGWHNVWVGKEGLKLQLYGQRQVEQMSPEAALRKLAAYTVEKSDLGWMQGLTRFLKRLEGKIGVYVDAGWKDGNAVAALVMMKPGGDAEIHIRRYRLGSNVAAELKAINVASKLWPGERIHSDCQGAVTMFGSPATWIPREQNREADALGNARGG